MLIHKANEPFGTKRGHLPQVSVTHTNRFKDLGGSPSFSKSDDDVSRNIAVKRNLKPFTPSIRDRITKKSNFPRLLLLGYAGHAGYAEIGQGK